MANLVTYIVGGFILLVSLWMGYLAVATGLLYRSVAGVEPSPATTVMDGDRVAVEGTVSVDESAPAIERAIPDAGSPVGMYVWRAAKKDVGKNVVDIRNLEVRPAKKTVEAGIESGTLRVSSSGKTVILDPEWIRDAHDAPKLTDFTAGPNTYNRKFHLYLWDSRYVHLTGNETEIPLDRLEGVIKKYDSHTTLDDMWLQSRPVREGDTLAVYGEASETDENVVIHGTDDVPLFITNEGFDGLRRKLMKTLIIDGVIFLVTLLISGAIIYYS